MDPLLISFGAALGGAAVTVATKLAEKVRDAALEPIAQRLQAPLKERTRQEAVAQAILTAIKEASKTPDDSTAIASFRETRLHEIVETGNEALRDEVMRLVLLATAEESFVSDVLMNALSLAPNQRKAVAQMLYRLHQQLYKLPEFEPLLSASDNQAVIAELKAMGRGIGKLASTVKRTHEGPAFRVEVVEPEWEEPDLRALANDCNELRLSGLQASQADPTKEKLVKLDAMYIDLEVETQVTVVKDKDGMERIVPHDELERLQAKQSLQRDEVQTRRMTALEAIALNESKRLVLLGEPGGGKTTFERHLVFRLATARLVNEGDLMQTLRGWTLGAPTP